MTRLAERAATQRRDWPRECRTLVLWCALLSFVVCPACVPAQRSEPPGMAAIWDFPAEVPGAALTLWPAQGPRPRRVRHQINSQESGSVLHAEVDGRDPYYTWQLESPLKSAAVRLQLESEHPGRFQVFWTCTQCPVFEEECSASEDVDEGGHIATFLIAARDAIRDVRVDLPEAPGQTFSFHSITVLAEPALDTPWQARSDSMKLDSQRYGLMVNASKDDPWMIIPTPGLHASRATIVEVTQHGPSEPPQLYWTGPCLQFSEDCSIRLEPVDSGALTHRADLRGVPRWTGDIHSLRFDPGPRAGEYRIERIALIHE